MKSWYSKVRDTELIDGSIRATYVVTFETDSIELKREVEKYLQGIMDRANRKTEPNGYKTKPVEDEPQTDCETCKYGQDKHRYAHICNECGVGINNYTPQTERSE